LCQVADNPTLASLADRVLGVEVATLEVYFSQTTSVMQPSLKSCLEPCLNFLGFLSVPKELVEVWQADTESPAQGIPNQTLFYF